MSLTPAMNATAAGGGGDAVGAAGEIVDPAISAAGAITGLFGNLTITDNQVTDEQLGAA